EYSALAMKRLGSKAPKPPTVGMLNGAPQLDDNWHTPTITDSKSDKQEQQAYRASWYVIDSLVKEIGVARMRKVIAAAQAGDVPYQASGKAEKLPGKAGYQRFLDLLENVGGSKRAKPLFEKYVLTTPENFVYEDRARARAAYLKLAARGGAWKPPFE